MEYTLAADPHYLTTLPHPENDGYFIVLPNKEKDVTVICWSSHKLPNGEYINVGRNYEGIVALYIPS